MQYQVITFLSEQSGYGFFIADVNFRKMDRATAAQPLEIMFGAGSGEVVPHKHVPAVL